jgi:hypothetical protein
MSKISMIRRRVYLRLLRWCIQGRSMPLANFWGAASALTIVAIPLWKRAGTATALPILADATPILLAIVGVVMSYIQPKRESHRATTFILIVAGLIGSGVLSANRIRSEAEHRKEVTSLGGKMDAVRDQNTNLSNFLIAAKNTGMNEADRKRGIETTLRNEYILSHDPIDPDILAGIKMPPDAWMNKRLQDLGESWTVSGEARLASSKSIIPRSYVVFVGDPRFSGRSEISTEGNNFQPGDPLAFNIHYKNSGPNPVQLNYMERATFIEPDSSAESLKSAMTAFFEESNKERHSPDFKENSQTLMKEEEQFTSAFVSTDQGHSLATQQELDVLKAGTNVAVVMAVITYKDNGVPHHLRRCLWLQPPAQSPGIWAFCAGFPDSD